MSTVQVSCPSCGPVPVRSSDIGWDGLTPTEERVAKAVSEGLRNREVAALLHMSAYTVGSHLRSIYMKLGINSRTELTRLAVERAFGLQVSA